MIDDDANNDGDNDYDGGDNDSHYNQKLSGGEKRERQERKEKEQVEIRRARKGGRVAVFQ